LKGRGFCRAAHLNKRPGDFSLQGKAHRT
jgi:hypothetical protein